VERLHLRRSTHAEFYSRRMRTNLMPFVFSDGPLGKSQNHPFQPFDHLAVNPMNGIG
jgi:hypothetical protein